MGAAGGKSFSIQLWDLKISYLLEQATQGLGFSIQLWDLKAKRL